MSTKTGVKIVSIMVLILFMVYLISLGMFWTCRPLKNHEATNLSVAVKIPVDDSVTDTKGIDDKDLQEITREAMVYLIRAMGTSYIGQMAISDDDLIPASIFSCIVCVIAIIFWAMLLIGVFKNNKCLILTWMVMTMLHLLVNFERGSCKKYKILILNFLAGLVHQNLHDYYSHPLRRSGFVCKTRTTLDHSRSLHPHLWILLLGRSIFRLSRSQESH